MNPESGTSIHTFGPGFNGADWNDAYRWLSEQDSEQGFSQRPAFVSWWDYGFQALAQGQHPTVADNFQSEFPTVEECFSHKDKKIHWLCS